MVSDQGTTLLNRSGWDAIGGSVVSPYMNYPHYSDPLSRLIDTVPAGGRILDLGCGPGGAVTRLLADTGFEVVGVDFAEEMISLARQAVPNATFLCRSMLDIDFEAEFDGVVASYSMLCLNPAEFGLVAAKIARSLRPQGLCFVALNEADIGEDADASALIEIAGQPMYSRAYSEAEVLGYFSEMTKVSVGRATVTTEMFGDEKSLVVLLSKG